MIPLAVGYRPPSADEEPFADLIAPYVGRVAEVYLAWPGEPSGRPPTARAGDGRFEADLRALRGLKVRISLLFNAACYGAGAGSSLLADRVLSVVRECERAAGLPDSVTTASPAIAYIVKRRLPGVHVRASVNLRLGSVAALAQMEELFDSFCIQRDVQRDLAHVARLRRWAEGHGKTLAMLANSGCLRYCAGQTWHDNLVAHLDQTAGQEPLPGFTPLTCRRFLADPARRQALLQATWVRPEDLHRYEGLVDLAKLATRSHPRPAQVIRAYASGRFRGNLLDLLEPGLGHALGEAILANERFPADWFEHAQRCPADGACPVCETVLRRAVVSPEEYAAGVDARPMPSESASDAAATDADVTAAVPSPPGKIHFAGPDTESR